MAYCTVDDLLGQISEDDTIALTDDAGDDEVNQDVIDLAVAAADAEIDSYCGGRYPVPFSPVPVMIRSVSIDLTIYNLFGRRSLPIPEDRQKRHENAIRWLRDVARGIIALAASDAPAETASGLPQATRDKTDRIFSLGKTSDGSSGTLDNY